MLKPTQEFIIGGLLLATLAVILANHFVPRTVAFDRHNIVEFFAADDRHVGGTSEASVEIGDGNFKMNYEVDAVSNPTPYAKVEIRLEDQNDQNLYRDLSWVDSFNIELRCSKPGGDHFLFTLRNFETEISKADDPLSLKYNESLIFASNEMSVVSVKRNDFLVPSWWKRQYDVKSEDGHTDFENVQWCEFITQGDAGSGALEVKSIKCSGHWINTAALNQTLLWLWMGGTLIGSLYRMFGLTKKLNEKTASAMELLKHNNLLMSESATYHELARRDPLTGLLNRYGMEGRFEQLAAATGGFSYTVILFDLDNFKQINDNHGHCYGDRVLFDVARIVNSKIGKSDIVARWGGDEFLIILVDRKPSEASEFTEEIRQAVRASDLSYTCSFGISKSVADATFEETFRNADTALYESKEDGRDTTNVFKNRKEDIEATSDVSSEEEDDSVPIVILPPVEPPLVGFSIYQ